MTNESHQSGPFVIGVLSDTHGTLPDAAYEALKGADAIVHAGDIGCGPVLDVLETIAPVVLVRGNNPCATEAGRPQVADVVLGGVSILVAHSEEDLLFAATPSGGPARVVVTGHTHVGYAEERDGVLRVNPGSPTQPRGGSAASVAIIEIHGDGRVTARLVPLI